MPDRASQFSNFLGSMKATLATMFDNLTQYYGNIADLLGDVSVLLSVVFMIIALVKLKAHAQNPDQNPMLHVVALFLVSGALGNIGLATAIGSNTLFGSGYSFMSYESVTQTDTLGESGTAILKGILGFVQLIGFIAFFKGLLMIRNMGKPGERPGLFSSGLVFVISGIFGINIVYLVVVMGNSLGLDGVGRVLGGG